MNKVDKAWLIFTEQEAKKSGHVFPSVAACEAALESGYGTSTLSKQDNNLFGMKAHSHNLYATHNLPTKEFLKGEWVEVNAAWVHYPDLSACFADRMSTLKRLSTVYPHYGSALAAKDPETYVRQVSQSWSTDPQRADKVLAIYNDYLLQMAA